MNEIYRDTTGKGVSLDITGATVTSVSFIRAGAVKETVTGNVNPVPVPYSITHMGGEFTIKWDYTVGGVAYSRSENFNVVTPLFTAEELIAFNSTFSTLSAEKVVALERMVRKVIEAHTGQSFGLEEGLVTTYGTGDSILLSDKRIISVNSVGNNGGMLPYSYRPINDGYAIERFGNLGYSGTFNVKADSDEWVEVNGFSSNGTIADPYSSLRARSFSNNVQYTINAITGWQTPPVDIKDAALILAESFSCKEAAWRDKYVKAITAADWRFDFDARAYAGTGSATVDKLLSRYVIGRMAVI